MVLLGVVAILIWQFAPIEGTVNKVLPQLNGTDGNGDTGDGGSSQSGGNNEGDSPTAAPAGYQFNQCADQTDLTTCCNGLDGICDLGVDEILWATSHNAMSSKDGGYFFGYNHIKQLEESMDAGYRALSLDICNCGGDYQLCHGICDLGARDPIEVFTNIVTFLNDNPSEVIMINLEVNSDVSDAVDLDTFAASLAQNVNGFSDKLYVHDDATAAWPSLGDLTASGKVRRPKQERLYSFIITVC